MPVPGFVFGLIATIAVPIPFILWHLQSRKQRPASPATATDPELGTPLQVRPNGPVTRQDTDITYVEDTGVTGVDFARAVDADAVEDPDEAGDVDVIVHNSAPTSIVPGPGGNNSTSSLNSPIIPLENGDSIPRVPAPKAMGDNSTSARNGSKETVAIVATVAPAPQLRGQWPTFPSMAVNNGLGEVVDCEADVGPGLSALAMMGYSVSVVDNDLDSANPSALASESMGGSSHGVDHIIDHIIEGLGDGIDCNHVAPSNHSAMSTPVLTGPNRVEVDDSPSGEQAFVGKGA